MRDAANIPNTVANEPMSTITSNPKMVYGTHDAIGLPPTTSGQ
jgi:hypothetical protein